MTTYMIRCSQQPLEKSFSYKPNGHWVSFSTAEMVEKARKLSMGLIKLGIQPGDKIGLVTYKNRPEWVIADIAISQIGAINVPFILLLVALNMSIFLMMRELRLFL
ncbi:MAG: AMP-binding protein [Saprospiraceae bacterium]